MIIRKQYQVISTNEDGVERIESVCSNELDAEIFAGDLARSYGPTQNQTIKVGQRRIISLTIRPIWNLNY
jgi:hypothetical protein